LGFLAALAGCASRESNLEEQLRRIQEQEAADQRAPRGEAPASAPRDPPRESQLTRLEGEVRRASDRLAAAEQSSDPHEVAAANASLAEAQRRLAAEKEHQRKLEELRARTPNHLIDVGSGSMPTKRTPSSRPASKPAPHRAVESRPEAASRPVAESRPAGPEDAEFDQLSERIRWLADLRQSGGDQPGAARLRRDLGKITAEYTTKNRAKALEALRKLAREADR
jgi:hypothetical protein